MTTCHWAFDGLAQRLPRDEYKIGKLLRDLAKAIEMATIAPAEVYRGEGKWCGLQLIAESHISVHGEGRMVWVDVFSCKAFEQWRVCVVLDCWLGMNEIDVQQLRVPNVRRYIVRPARQAGNRVERVMT